MGELGVHRERRDDPGVVALLAAREAYLRGLYPERAELRRDVEAAADVVAFYGLRQDGALVGCGSLLRHPGFLELKTVFVAEEVRGQGLGQYLVRAIEAEAEALGCGLLRLEVGTRQGDAVRLYRALGYVETAAFAPYRPDPVSLFMEKRLEA